VEKWRKSGEKGTCLIQPFVSVHFVYVKWKHFCVFEVHRHCSNMSFRRRSRRMRWVKHVARMGERRGAYMILVGRPEGNRPITTPKFR
jgi:hypothetical protein